MRRFRRAHAPLLLPLVLACSLSLPSVSSAGPPATDAERAARIKQMLSPQQSVVVTTQDGVVHDGTFRGLGDGETSLVMNVYDDANDRFRAERHGLQDIASLNSVQSSPNWLVPAASGVVLAGAGVWLGHSLGSIDGEDPTEAMLILGLVGGMVGTLVGIVFAPKKTKEVALW